ncbi:hypothetical protein CHARACLAT_020858 [Characodon lateralis]|uniref:RanBP-type and C3HC4-type zinc finger-containing protein 1 n=1 Tax=Characodon lateralis TaxID=208331 RepID=A0ABU7DT25_9TELE|nr:hypothetical protein [Characodon lateralis]
MASEDLQRRNLKEAEELALSLGEAISSGESEEAANLCKKLSQLSVTVSVSIKSHVDPQDSIRLMVGVEDAQSENYIPVTLAVSTGMKIAELKDKISHDFGFHPTLQRWVIGKRLAHDQETLYSHGIRKSGDQAFLFILSAQAAHLTRQQHNQDQEQQRLASIVESMQSIQLYPRGVGGDDKTAPPPVPPKNKATPQPAVAAKPQLGWACTMCTYVNKPTRPGCEMCGGDRPQDYEVPDIYQPDQEEVLRIEQEQLAVLQYEEAQQLEREKNYMYLLATDEQNLISNTTETDCPICFSPLEPGEGVVLRECLHTFCRECLKGTLINSQDAEVYCPDTDCESKLLDREIKELLTEEEHQRFLELRLNIAESRSEHSFHCQTPNCRGWCIYEDEVNEFNCSLCNEINCILCRAIHKDMNCKDYQDDLRIRAENDKAAQQTKQMLEACNRAWVWPVKLNQTNVVNHG